MEKINPNKEVEKGKSPNLKVLIAPLDWGLGHTTRCIPLAHALIKRGVTVFFAGNQQQKAVLRQEFPDNIFLHLDGYNIRYSKTASGLTWKLATQLIPIKRKIAAEHRWLLQQVREHQFDAIISDNRFGLWHPNITSIFITHQLLIKTPFKWAEKLLQKINYGFLNRFNACWVPDMPGKPNLAGELSHPEKMPAIPVEYIGVLSRLQLIQAQKTPKHLFVSLSGPEPQRSLLEASVLQQLQDYSGTATVVRGMPEAAVLPAVAGHINIYNHLNTAEYNKAIAGAEIVISRTGYSTVMDVIAVQQKSILIPTPGQTEQEYLADYLPKQKLAICYPQQNFNLMQALKEVETFNYQPISTAPLYETVLDDFLLKLKSK